MARGYWLRGSCYLNRKIKGLPEVTRQNPEWNPGVLSLTIMAVGAQLNLLVAGNGHIGQE